MFKRKNRLPYRHMGWQVKETRKTSNSQGAILERIVTTHAVFGIRKDVGHDEMLLRYRFVKSEEGGFLGNLLIRGKSTKR